MTGISPKVICHRVHVDLTFKPVKQKAWLSSPHQVWVVDKEMDRFLGTGSIREVQFHLCKEENQEVVSMCGFHGFEQGVSEG